MKHIKFDGFNFTEVDNFINNIKGCANDSILLIHEEGEINFNGYYYKGPCYIVVDESIEDMYVLPERFVSYIIGEFYD